MSDDGSTAQPAEATSRSGSAADGPGAEPLNWVLHVDLDQFLAAVEVGRRPELRGRPVIVGGSGDPTQARVVVATASYEARRYGVHSGMPLRTAARRCPDAVFLPTDHPAYEAASAKVMATLRSFPVVVEEMGWDEAFVGASTPDPEALAARLKDAVESETGLSCAVGIGDNKLQAKFVTLKLQPPEAPAALLRSYSLAAPAGGSGYRIGVKREPAGQGSSYLHDQVELGDVLEVGAPRGTFTLAADTDADAGAGDVDGGIPGPVALLSAGVGVTPVLAMLGALAEASSKRPVWWVHGARGGDEHAFAADARAMLAVLPVARSHVRYSEPRPEDRRGVDFDAVGRIDLDALLELGIPQEADFYLCGPSAFLRDLTGALLGWGVEPGRLHREVFGPEVKDDAPDPHPPPGPGGHGPAVAFSRSALTVPWDDRYGSLLELAEACDVPADWSCRTGACHRCEAGLVDGAVDYEPEPLDDPAPGQVLMCSARPRGPVTVDL